MSSFLRTIIKPPSPIPVPPAALTQTRPAPIPVALQGDIRAIALENVFQLLDFAALTGKLDIFSKTNSGTFYFNNGVLVHGLLRVNHRRIGQILLDSRIITEQQLEECLRIHEQSGARKRFGQILVEKGYANPSMLDKSLLRQVKEAFFETLSWNEGTFRFYAGQVPAANEMQVHGRIDRLLLEGMVHIDQASLEQEED